MLILSRRMNESIIIGGDIKIMVVQIRMDKVRLGIQADKHISIHREEIQALIDREARREEGRGQGEDERCR